MKQQAKKEIQAGLFVIAGFTLFVFSLMTLGDGISSLFKDRVQIRAGFDSATGLVPGSLVRYGGITVGQVEQIDLSKPAEDDSRVYVQMAIEDQFSDRIPEDVKASIATLGMLGDKYIELIGGTPSAPPIETGDVISSSTGGGVEAIMASSEDLVKDLNSAVTHLNSLLASLDQANRNKEMFGSIAESSQSLSRFLGTLEPRGALMKDIRATVSELKEASEKMNSNEGTIGLLLNDPQLYNDLRKLLGGANQSGLVKFLIEHSLDKEDEKKK